MKRSFTSSTTENDCHSNLKRVKVQAQRKFAQNASGPSCSGAYESPGNAVAARPHADKCTVINAFSKLPSVDDFFTFLCFRGTQALPERLNYLNTPKLDALPKAARKSKSLAFKKENRNIARDITNTCSAIKNNEYKLRSSNSSHNKHVTVGKSRVLALKHNQRLRSMSVVQAKIQENKLQSQIRKRQLLPNKSNSHTSKPLESSKNRPVTRALNQIIRKQSEVIVKENEINRRVTRRSSLPERKSSILRETQDLTDVRRSVRMKPFYEFPSESNSSVSSMSSVSSFATTTATSTLSFSSFTRKSSPKAKPSPKKTVEPRKTSPRRKVEVAEPTPPSTYSRPSRRTKEAAALYMEMLGKDLLCPEEHNVDDDTISVESFPELPNTELLIRREKEIKEMSQRESMARKEFADSQKRSTMRKELVNGRKRSTALVDSRKRSTALLNGRKRSTATIESRKQSTAPVDYRKRSVMLANGRKPPHVDSRKQSTSFESRKQSTAHPDSHKKSSASIVSRKRSGTPIDSRKPITTSIETRKRSTAPFDCCKRSVISNNNHRPPSMPVNSQKQSSTIELTKRSTASVDNRKHSTTVVDSRKQSTTVEGRNRRLITCTDKRKRSTEFVYSYRRPSPVRRKISSSCERPATKPKKRTASPTCVMTRSRRDLTHEKRASQMLPCTKPSRMSVEVRQTRTSKARMSQQQKIEPPKRVLKVALPKVDLRAIKNRPNGFATDSKLSVNGINESTDEDVCETSNNIALKTNYIKSQSEDDLLNLVIGDDVVESNNNVESALLHLYELHPSSDKLDANMISSPASITDSLTNNLSDIDVLDSLINPESPTTSDCCKLTSSSTDCVDHWNTDIALFDSVFYKGPTEDELKYADVKLASNSDILPQSGISKKDVCVSNPCDTEMISTLPDSTVDLTLATLSTSETVFNLTIGSKCITVRLMPRERLLKINGSITLKLDERSGFDAKSLERFLNNGFGHMTNACRSLMKNYVIRTDGKTICEFTKNGGPKCLKNGANGSILCLDDGKKSLASSLTNLKTSRSLSNVAKMLTTYKYVRRSLTSRKTIVKPTDVLRKFKPLPNGAADCRRITYLLDPTLDLLFTNFHVNGKKTESFFHSVSTRIQRTDKHFQTTNNNLLTISARNNISTNTNRQSRHKKHCVVASNSVDSNSRKSAGNSNKIMHKSVNETVVTHPVNECVQIDKLMDETSVEFVELEPAISECIEDISPKLCEVNTGGQKAEPAFNNLLFTVSESGDERNNLVERSELNVLPEPMDGVEEINVESTMVDSSAQKDADDKSTKDGQNMSKSTEKSCRQRLFFSRSDKIVQTCMSPGKRFSLDCRKITKIDNGLAGKTDAFSPDNEDSVYAFEPDLPVASPPFRRSKSITPRKIPETKKNEKSSKVSDLQRKLDEAVDSRRSTNDRKPTNEPQHTNKELNQNTSQIKDSIATTSSTNEPKDMTCKTNVSPSWTRSRNLKRTQPWVETWKRQAPLKSNKKIDTKNNNCKKSLDKSKTVKNKTSIKHAVIENDTKSKKDSLSECGQILEAPTFYPSEKEFNDPLQYIETIRSVAEKYGVCRIVPPSNFKPECKVSDDMRFMAYNQYVHKMLNRWGPNVKEMMAIRKYLATQNITLTHPPWIGGMEVDLPRLYQTVQQCGGLKEVIEKEKWQQVADIMKIPKLAQDRLTKLDDIYCKYLLPYDTLSHNEREKLFEEVEKRWNQHLKNPDLDDELFDDIDECIAKGRTMPLSSFYRIARNTMWMHYGLGAPDVPPVDRVEEEFWRQVASGEAHVCVHAGSVDSAARGYGFSVAKNSAFRKHPWNLKVLTNNATSVLRSLGPVMGITVPTLHVGMLYSTCCWYRDPHGLPWIEYLHAGADKIWYGIPDEYSDQLREAMLVLVPRHCHGDKKLWLPSDSAMIPPSLLTARNVSLSRVVQQPGQFVVVFPRSFTSSVATGYVVSESVYFAHPSWLATAEQMFRDMQESREPSVFSLEQLLISIANDVRASVSVLKKALPLLVEMRDCEVAMRSQLEELGLRTVEQLNVKKGKCRGNFSEDDNYECDICRVNLYISLVINSHEQTNYCLRHAANLLYKKPAQVKYCKLMYTYTKEELEDLINKVEEKVKSNNKKKPNGRGR